jgi:hypothetical protein
MINMELMDLSKQAIEKYFKSVLEKKDDVSLILAAHLYVEYWIEQFVCYSLPHPDKILDSCNLKFLEKLALAQSLGFDSDSETGLIEAIKKLNSLRNKISHDLDFKISKVDLQLLSVIKLNLGKDAKKSIKEYEPPKGKIIAICLALHSYVVGFIQGRIDRKKEAEND